MRFSEIVGHRRLTTLLSRAVDRGTLPPTLLFVGPSGVGKWRTAIATAAAVNCLDPVRQSSPELPIDGCGKCRSCDRIAREVHVDVLALEPDDRASIKIDVVRDLLSRVGYRPFEGKRRFVLVRDAETLEPAAQNALLKSLEEPTPATTFILVTTIPGALLPTVRSRCMRMTFGRLTPAELAAALVRDHGYSEAKARSTVPLANGSLGHALGLSDADVTSQRDLAMQLLQQTARRGDAQTKLQAASALVGPPKKERSRDELAFVLRLTSSMLRDIEVLNAGADQSVLANPVIADDLAKLAPAFSGNRARDAFTAIDQALMALERNAGVKVVAEWLAVQI
ncbi:MAG: ATP-binding protein [Vicinamibacterales bacterium]